MKTLDLRLCALVVGCNTIVACSQAVDPSRFLYAPNVIVASGREPGPLSYRVLHNFGGDHDGNYLISNLVSIGDTLYSTTANGGTYGLGTVFGVTKSGSERVLYSFGKPIRGRSPYGGLTDVDAALYGTTAYGGGFGYGTFFSITADGRERVLHSFGKGDDAKSPSAELLDVGGTLYGTSELGGVNACAGTDDGCGTIFVTTTDGTEKVLHSFGKGSDGQLPTAGLTDVGGTLYGTTARGGARGYGTVFSITRDGRERVLYSFRGKPDGAGPGFATLLDVNGTLYGTTESGGRNACADTSDGCGTIFRITTDGSETMLHSFSGRDGEFPTGSLIYVDGKLYGTTVSGGANNCGPNVGGCGTVFSLTTRGTEQVLHNFNGADGNGPVAGLLYQGGSFFGTTQNGGRYAGPHKIGGVLFSLTL